MKKIFAALILAMLVAPAFAQTVVATTKPIVSGWSPADFSSAEVRLVGRLSTDALTTHKIIKRITFKGLDVALLTQRVTVLVPAAETWEVQSVAVNFVPVIATGIRAFAIETLNFSKPYLPTSGQTLAIDVNPATGVILMGPVTPAPAPAPTPAPVAAISVSPASLSLTVTLGAACSMPFTVSNHTAAQLSVSYYDSMAWMMDLLPKAHLTPQPIPANGSQLFTLICSSASRGTFAGNGTITAAGTMLTLPTTLTVQ
jgi:hypothetical protein